MNTMCDSTLLERAKKLREIMNDHIRSLSSQQRDRILQVHLAQARGQAANAALLRKSMNYAIRLRAARANAEGKNG